MKTLRKVAAASIAVIAVVTLGACSHQTHSAARSGEQSSATEGTTTAAVSARLACDIGDKANITSFVTQYIVPGTERKGLNSSNEVDAIGGSQCEYRWTGRSASDRDDDAPDDFTLNSYKYGTADNGENKDAQSVIQLGQRMAKKGSDDPLNPGFQPLVMTDIGAGAVIGVDEFWVAGTHGYYYEVGLGNWKPSPEVIPSFQAMARAIVKADQ